MSFNIRLATEKDFEKIHALNREFSQFIKTPEKFKITVDQMRREQEHFRILVAE
jgi:predicted N-acetyltransferase YhbS